MTTPIPSQGNDPLNPSRLAQPVGQNEFKEAKNELLKNIERSIANHDKVPGSQRAPNHAAVGERLAALKERSLEAKDIAALFEIHDSLVLIGKGDASLPAIEPDGPLSGKPSSDQRRSGEPSTTEAKRTSLFDLSSDRSRSRSVSAERSSTGGDITGDHSRETLIKDIKELIAEYKGKGRPLTLLETKTVERLELQLDMLNMIKEMAERAAR
jgi:hypothetical protein